MAKTKSEKNSIGTGISAIVFLLISSLAVGYQVYPLAVWAGGFFLIYLLWTLVHIIDDIVTGGRNG